VRTSCLHLAPQYLIATSSSTSKLCRCRISVADTHSPVTFLDAPITFLDAEVDVSAGTIDISVMYSGLPIYSETRDLCDMATCPIKTGPLEIDFDQYLPPIVSQCQSCKQDIRLVCSELVCS
jgi:hypothetical protein